MRRSEPVGLAANKLMESHVPRKLYFAYGSNLYKPQMQMRTGDSGTGSDEYANRCPDSVEVATYTLREHRLAFVGEGTQRWGRGGVATVIPAAGQAVHGALYRISAADEEVLDGMEGGYYNDEETITRQGEHVLMYVATAAMGSENPPSAKYLNRIREGYRQWGLPLEALAGIKPN